jgi:hypothetical protein
MHGRMDYVSANVDKNSNYLELLPAERNVDGFGRSEKHDIGFVSRGLFSGVRTATEEEICKTVPGGRRSEIA